MRMIDLIVKKRDAQTLTTEELAFIVNGYTDGSIPDYQMAAWLMAGYLNGFSAKETANLTLLMAQSGNQMNLSKINGIKVDKHSTGGVGDKTTLIVGPIAAACGVPIAKMSGRGLGHTGGTADKLESIPGYQIVMGMQDFLKQIQQIGIALVSQTDNLAPADKKIYALRDVIGTVESIPLIAASIMSKKIAAGADAILLDVKVGNGAFMQTLQQAQELANTMVQIGEKVGRKTMALLTNMDIPLGNAIGNQLEVIESIEILKGRGNKNLMEICLVLASYMLYLADKGSLEICKKLAQQAIEDGSAFEKLRQVVIAQGGDVSYIDDPKKFQQAPIIVPYTAKKEGYISKIDTKKCGIACCILGAGRERKEDIIDEKAGMVLQKNYGDYVKQGETIAVLHTSKQQTLNPAIDLLDDAFLFSECPPEKQILIYRS